VGTTIGEDKGLCLIALIRITPLILNPSRAIQNIPIIPIHKPYLEIISLPFKITSFSINRAKSIILIKNIKQFSNLLSPKKLNKIISTFSKIKMISI
jgi:hypothetical protein